MQGAQGDGFMLEEDRERLPWLEPAEPIEEIEAVSLYKVLALVLLGLVLLGLIVGGGWWLKSRGTGNSGGDAALISPPAGDYKIPADSEAARKYDVDGKAFEGEGDSAFDASAGGTAQGRIDPSKAPEMPMTEAVKPAPATPEPKPVATPAASAAVPAPVPTASPAPVLGGARVQLGAYNSKAIAEEAWRRLIKRFEDLGTAKHAVEPVETGGKTLYRLRMGAADRAAASALCGRLRVAGENCFVVP